MSVDEDWLLGVGMDRYGLVGLLRFGTGNESRTTSAFVAFSFSFVARVCDRDNFDGLVFFFLLLVRFAVFLPLERSLGGGMIG